MSELKPCPFCGGNKLTVSRYFGLNCYTVRCINENCGMKVVTDFAKTKKEAIELWNKRSTPWHTGTPTEKGWYLCAYDTDIYLANYWVGSGWLKQYRAEGIDCRQGLVAWQKIERIEASKERKK